MDKIVILGNGFDIAHGLPTRYSDFMKYLKETIVQKEIISDSSFRYKTLGKTSSTKSGYIHKLNQDSTIDPWIGVEMNQFQNEYQFEPNPEGRPRSVYFKSLFNAKNKMGLWSDLEEHYYNALIALKDRPDVVKIVNKEFDHLKNLLSNYLETEIETGMVEERQISYNKSNPFSQILMSNKKSLKFKNTYFITFNYNSKILENYVQYLTSEENISIPIRPIYIHGKVNDTSTPIIFGYGDDNTIDFEELRDKKDVEYLKNFKTYQYLRSEKYNQIIGLLNSQRPKYIQIIGHSCELCDKALLRTIFQHPNVAKIESTYYGNEENYFEKIYNISRIFDQIELMRIKVVPLESTYKLPDSI